MSYGDEAELEPDLQLQFRLDQLADGQIQSGEKSDH